MLLLQSQKMASLDKIKVYSAGQRTGTESFSTWSSSKCPVPLGLFFKYFFMFLQKAKSFDFYCRFQTLHLGNSILGYRKDLLKVQ